MQNHEAPDIDFAPTVAREVAYVLEHLNEAHADTVLLLASFGGGTPGLISAELARADRAGVLLLGRLRDGSSIEVRLPFAKRPASLLATRAELFGLLATARSLAGDSAPLTSLEEEIARTARLRTFVTTVDRVEDITPSLRRVVVRGELEAFEPCGPDQFVFMMVPRPGGDPSPIVPGFRLEHFQAMPESERPAAAYYTVRRWDPGREAIELWIVLHDADGGVGGWARRARPGDRVALCGPRTSFAPPAGTRSFLLITDESGLAATAAILDDVGRRARVHVVAQTSDAAHMVELPRGPQVSITWLFRGQERSGSEPALLDEVRRLTLDPVGLYAFGAGESEEIGSVRRYLRDRCSLQAAQIRMIAYWRRDPPAARRDDNGRTDQNPQDTVA